MKEASTKHSEVHIDAIMAIFKSAVDWAEKESKNFSSTKDFSGLTVSLVNAYSILTGEFPMSYFGFASFLTDINSGEDNELIIRESSKMEIEPAKNYAGTRVEAASCLAQIIERSLNAKQPSR